MRDIITSGQTNKIPCYIISVGIPSFILPVWIGIAFRLFGVNAGFQYGLFSWIIQRIYSMSGTLATSENLKTKRSIKLRQFILYALDSRVQIVWGDIYRRLHYQIGHGASRAGGSCDEISNVTLKGLHCCLVGKKSGRQER